MKRALWAWAVPALLVAAVLSGCGGGGGGSSAATGSTPIDNVQAVSVNAGPTGQFPNTVLTSVTVCVPGTQTCQTIPNVMVDTGSTGLRLLASVLTIALPPVTSPTTGHAYSECTDFADGVTWGAVSAADIRMAGESAGSVPVQVIQDNGVGPALPASCAALGTPEDSLALFGANGIIGVGLFLQDCGVYCVTQNDGGYYDCDSSGACTAATMALATQVSNPVAGFAQDNNGVILQLPAIADGGAASVDGSMTFGIGTQADNALAGTVISVPDSGATAGDFTATYQGVSLPNSFFDSGSSGLFFDDASMAQCAANGVAGGFYCPGSAAALSATPISVTISVGGGASTTLSATVANAEFLFAESGGTLTAFDNLAAPAGPALPNAFDFGVPFFFGRRVFTGFEQPSTGAAPYVAFQAAS